MGCDSRLDQAQPSEEFQRSVVWDLRDRPRVVILCIIVARHHVRRQNELLMAVSTVVNNKALLIILRHSRLVSRTLIITGVVVVSRLNLAMGV